MTTRERRERRAERRREWQEGREQKAESARASLAQRRAELPPTGEPIKVGHHSERAHRRAFDRADRALEKVIEHGQMADHHRSAADAIERELSRSIYSDDADAIGRLQERIDELERERQRMKAINAWLTKHGGVPRRRVPMDAPDELRRRVADALSAARVKFEIADAEMLKLVDCARFSQTLGYPSYALRNIGGNINRQRKRLATLTERR